jgi:hypothetical protein
MSFTYNATLSGEDVQVAWEIARFRLIVQGAPASL